MGIISVITYAYSIRFYVCVWICVHMTLKSRGISAVDANRIRKLNETYLEVEV